MSDIDEWAESQEFQVHLDGHGKIIDYLNPEIRRENTPEERIRQKMVQIIHCEFGYPKELIAVERGINIGREKRRADIVVYQTGEAQISNDQGKVLIISEVKAPDIKMSDGQLASYISATSAQGGFWTNGDKIDYYRRDFNDGNIVEWMGIPKYGQAWDGIGKFQKSDLIIPIDLKLVFKRCHNAIYRTGINSEDVALDMVRIILAKIEDEISSSADCEFHITPEEYGNPELRHNACERVRQLFSYVRLRHKDIFSENEKISASDEQLSIVISQLQHYSFMDSPHDVIGTAYETYVASHLKGERGQYFTNRIVVNMMVKMLNPDEKSIILDPACGSGGFLLTSMNYIFDNIDKSNRTANSKDIIKRNVVHQLFGVDISPKLIKIAKANMLLGKDGHGGIEHGNSLDDVDKLSPKFTSVAGLGLPDIILTNPPFGSGHDLRIKESEILSQYKVGHMWDVDSKGNVTFSEKINDKQGVAPEVLFLEKCIRWVKEEGLIGIVMAKGQLDNREAYAVRKLILKETQVLAVVNLHEDTFEPFCGSRASVLFLKKTKNKTNDYRIYMAISNKIGQTSRGETIFKKDSLGNPIVEKGFYLLDEDLSEIAADYNKFKQGELIESQYRFTISLEDLDRSSLSLNPIHYLPQHNEALRKILELDEDKFDIKTLGDIADRVFNGPRFKRPYADKDVTEGPTIRKYYTGTALTQLNGDNVKYLDTRKADKLVQKQLDELTIHEGYILISDSGTLGRVTYALKQHDGHVATNNLIRVVIGDRNLRGYVYQFLKSDIGQSMMLKNAYGTNQEHLEPDVISEVLVPIPKDRSIIDEIGGNTLDSIESLERSIERGNSAINKLKSILP